MPIQEIEQPAVIQIDPGLRLRKYDGKDDFALAWYQDEETVYLVDGKRNRYTAEKLKEMYTYLNRMGELYFIKVLQDNAYKPIGDVTFWQEDMPIVIGDKSYRGKGIGKKVVRALVARGKALGFQKMYVADIYTFNQGSRRCFESVGFREYAKTEMGAKYLLDLS